MRQRFALVGLLLGSMLWAQEGPKISTAIIQFDRNKDTAAAKKYIKEAADIIAAKNLSEVKSKDLTKFYFNQGKINYAIATSKNPTTRAMDIDALDIAAGAFEKLVAFETKEGKPRYSDQARQFMASISNQYIIKGSAANDEKNYMDAYKYFSKTYDYKKSNGLGVDTAMLYNASLMAQNAENYPEAISRNKQLIDMGYKGQQYKATLTETGATQEFANRNQMKAAVASGAYSDPRVEGDLRPDLYINLANLYQRTEDSVNFASTVAKGRELYPGNKSLLLMELQKYLDSQEYDKAMVNLDQAIASDPSNALYPYLKGYIYQTEMKDPENAKVAYAKSIELDPERIEGQYMSGLIYVEKANEITEEMNKLSLNQQSKYNALQKEQQENFQNALPFFEKARQIDPDDMDTLKALKEVYYKLKMYQEAKDVQAEIDAKG